MTPNTNAVSAPSQVGGDGGAGEPGPQALGELGSPQLAVAVLRHRRSLPCRSSGGGATAVTVAAVRAGAERPARHEDEEAPAEDRPRGPEVAHARERPDRHQQQRRGGERGQLRAPAPRGLAEDGAGGAGRSATRASSSPRVRAPNARPSRCSSSSGVSRPSPAASRSRSAASSRSESDASRSTSLIAGTARGSRTGCGAAPRPGPARSNEPASSTSRKERWARASSTTERMIPPSSASSPGARTKIGSPG